MESEFNRKIGDIDFVQRNQTDHRKTNYSSEIPLFQSSLKITLSLIDIRKDNGTERRGRAKGGKIVRSGEIPSSIDLVRWQTDCQRASRSPKILFGH